MSDERGFTLVELLVAMALTIATVFAGLALLDTSTREAARATTLNDASDQARSALDGLVVKLRDAGDVVTASPTELMLRSPGGAYTQICLTSAGRLVTASSAAAPDPTHACPVAGWASGPLLRRTVFAPVFAWNPARPAAVAITLTTDAGSGGRRTTLQSAAVLRNAGATP